MPKTIAEGVIVVKLDSASTTDAKEVSQNSLSYGVLLIQIYNHFNYSNTSASVTVDPDPTDPTLSPLRQSKH
jgi:hypothetical protein